MPKRKAAPQASRKKAAKSARAQKGDQSGAAAAAAAAPAENSAAAALDRVSAAADKVQLAMRRSVHSLKFSRLMDDSDVDGESKLTPLIEALEKDGSHPQPLIDLAFKAPGEDNCVLFQLLDCVAECCVANNEADPENEDFEYFRLKMEISTDLVSNRLMPLLQKRLPSFDPATVDNSTGNNALHELCRLFTLTVRDEYDCKLAKQLIELGVSVHARSKKGRTPLLEYAATSSTVRSADGIRLLLAHGADINAQDDEGNGVLHHIVKGGALLLLEDLLDGSEARCLDLWAVNRAGRTAVDAANFAGSAAANAAQLLQTQLAAWKESVRPLLLDAFSALLIPDLAAIVMAFVDGSGPPFAQPADQADADADAGAAAAGVADAATGVIAAAAAAAPAP